VTHEEALAVVVGVDEPAGDVVGAVAAHLSRRRVVDVDAISARWARFSDETAWSTLYSTVSRPFAPPETGKLAVKVINHYGDEVLKVFKLA
jgi:hypothetical protein